MSEVKVTKRWTSRKIAVVTLLGSVGGVSSIPIGWGGTALAVTPVGPIAGQTLAGLHVIWLVLAAILVENRGAATASGALKGVVEMILPNHLNVIVIFMSFLEGAVVDLVLLPLRRAKTLAVLLASGFSSASNLLVLQVFQLLPSSLSLPLNLAMYGVSFVSGLVFAGYLSTKSTSVLKWFKPI